MTVKANFTTMATNFRLNLLYYFIQRSKMISMDDKQP